MGPCAAELASFSRAGCPGAAGLGGGAGEDSEVAVVERAVWAVSSGARRGPRCQAIGEKETSRWA